MEILAPVLSSIITSSIVVWLAKTWLSERLKASIKNEYDQKFELFKSKLKAESDVAFAQVQAQLQIDNARFKIEYGRIHEKRLEFISELVIKLTTLIESFAHYVSIVEYSSTPPKEDRRKATAESFKEFDIYYRRRRLFLPVSIISQIEEFKKTLYSKSMDFMLFVEQARESGATGAKQTDTWMKASKYANEEAPKIIAKLEDEFRKLLGM